MVDHPVLVGHGEEEKGPPRISIGTARRYLRRLGFEKDEYKQGHFFDNHDREDVVADRHRYLDEKIEQDKVTLHEMPTEDDIKRYLQQHPSERPYIEIVHDESACNANDKLSWQWVDAKAGERGKLRSKSNGAGIMISAFITEVMGGVMEGLNQAMAAETL